MLAAVLALAALSRAGAAATPEEAYFAARDAAIAKIKAVSAAHKTGPTEPDDKRVYDEDVRALAALEPRMRALIGAVAIKGVTENGKLSLDGLTEGDEGFGMIDGLAFEADDGKTRFLATTKTMLRHWLREHKDWWGKGAADIPQEMSAAVRADAFYTQGVSTDSAVILYAELPVQKPAGADFVFTTLAARTQDRAPAKANEMFVALARGGRVYVANTSAFSAVGPIAACDAMRADYDRQAGAVWEAYRNSGLSEQALREKSDALSRQADVEFMRCFRRGAAGDKGFIAAARAAQALLDRLPVR